ncbi:snRNA-activating protein complex subunit 3 [Hyalella azteca]|uniref:snRNA-activating protein complex subunit 3 n=1 Tax=Hyalella azteca TaxID=294128 RepID=A0A8B7PCN5_HYAAZ|nr:snRNA-activating protein complex subunit 3 [Hyalella azteca]
MERDCGIDLLTVPNELPSNDRLDDATSIDGQKPTNWFSGSFCDGVIPEGGANRLLTLYHQTSELNKRISIGDYANLRYRTLKYFTTFRLPQEINDAPMSSDFLEDAIINVRVQRPFFKRLHYRKACNRFPAHSQELLLHSSQMLTSLRDAIECVNDFAVHENMASNPSVAAALRGKKSKEKYPSGMFYINGTFYVDMRYPGCKDYSANLIKWAARFPEIGELKTASMEKTKLNELKLRLGYPYLYLHQGSCEHLITFTDIRLQEKTDVPDVSKYPLVRGHASKLSVRCYTCHHNLAQWVVIGYSQLSDPRSHLCDPCLHAFCYDSQGKPKDSFTLYAFYDEGSMQLAKVMTLDDNDEDNDNDGENDDDGYQEHITKVEVEDPDVPAVSGEDMEESDNDEMLPDINN